LVRGKEKNILNPSQKKPPIQVLEEIAQGKISIRKSTTDLQKKEIKESNASPSE
jgi:DNA-directed RNA polymerase subunit K/omega